MIAPLCRLLGLWRPRGELGLGELVDFTVHGWLRREGLGLGKGERRLTGSECLVVSSSAPEAEGWVRDVGCPGEVDGVDVVVG